MTSEKCVDPKIGNMMHAYEIDGLDDAEVDLFEAHILVCDHCFDSLVCFEEEANIIESDGEIKSIVEGYGQHEEKPSLLTDIWNRYLFPRFPFVFRPAFLIALILILLWPAYMSIVDHQDRAGYLYPIGLSALRSTTIDTHEISSEKDIVLSIACRHYNAESRYSVSIGNEHGDTIFDDDDFANFDKHGIGRVYLPRGLLKTGLHIVEISTSDNDTSIVVYKFNVTMKQ